ncbi:hypothetical protein JCM10449v2_004860 [Rhodotorula kratochvilovae]
MPSPAVTSPFHRLPHELLEHIAATVHEQDQEILNSDVFKQSLEVDPATESWWGKGISALSLADKRLRAAAMPFLAKTIQANQLVHPLLRYDAIPPAIINGVETLDLDKGNTRDIIAGAPALRGFRSIKHVVVNTHASSLMHTDSRAGLVGLAGLVRNSVIAGTAQVVKLELADFDSSAANPGRWIHPFARPATLRHLALGTPLYGRWQLEDGAGDQLAQLLRECSQLAELEVYENIVERCGFFAAVAGAEGDEARVVLPTLKSLQIFIGSRAFLPFVPQLAPNLTSLYLDVVFAPEEDEPNADFASLASLLALELLSLHGDARNISALLRLSPLPTSPSFVELNLFISTVVAVGHSANTALSSIDGAHLFPPAVELRPGLAVMLDLPRLMVLEQRGALERRCADAGATLRIDRDRHPLSPFERAASAPEQRAERHHGWDGPEDAGESDDDNDARDGESAQVRVGDEDNTVRAAQEELRREAMRGTLEWAAGEIEWLRRSGDDAGLQELAVALKRVEELRLLKRM